MNFWLQLNFFRNFQTNSINDVALLSLLTSMHPKNLSWGFSFSSTNLKTRDNWDIIRRSIVSNITAKMPFFYHCPIFTFGCSSYTINHVVLNINLKYRKYVVGIFLHEIQIILNSRRIQGSLLVFWQKTFSQCLEQTHRRVHIKKCKKKKKKGNTTRKEIINKHTFQWPFLLSGIRQNYLFGSYQKFTIWFICFIVSSKW